MKLNNLPHTSSCLAYLDPLYRYSPLESINDMWCIHIILILFNRMISHPMVCASSGMFSVPYKYQQCSASDYYLLTLICANTLECARTRVDRRHDLHQRAPCAQTGQTGYGDRSDRFYRECREDLKPREGPRRSSWIQGCSEVGRPLRIPSNAVETNKEQQMRLEKLGFGGKSKG